MEGKRAGQEKKEIAGRKIPADAPRSAFFVLSLLLVFTGLSAREKPLEPDQKKIDYNSATSFSLVMVKGNNDNLSFSIDTDHHLAFMRNRLNLKGRFIKASSNGVKVSEIHYAHLKYDRQIKTRAYLLGFVRYERNKLAGYNYRIALSGGAGATWIKRPAIEMSSELAFGWNNENNTNRVALTNVSGNIWQKAINSAFLSSIFTHKLMYTMSKNAKLVHQETLFLNVENMVDYRLSSFSSISASINRWLALQSSFQIVYEHQPVEGFKNTDYFLLSSVVLKI